MDFLPLNIINVTGVQAGVQDSYAKRKMIILQVKLQEKSQVKLLGHPRY